MRSSCEPNRRRFLQSASLGALALFLPRTTAIPRGVSFYVGTYTRGKSEGIYSCRLSPEGALDLEGTTGGIKNPSFLSLDPAGKHLYAVSETGEFNGESTGSVTAYRIRDGELSPQNSVSSGGTGPCHITIDRTGRFGLVANYSGGTVAVIRINGDGSLGPPTSVIRHAGRSVDPERQTSPHPHQVVLSPDNNFAYVPDLGLDRVMVYRFDASSGTLTPAEPQFFATAPGSGPRHMAFHPEGKYAFIICELNSTIIACTVQQQSGTLKELQTISTLPEGFGGISYCAEIVASGKFVYGSNRGANSIVVAAIGNGRLTILQQYTTLVTWPRNFAIDPSGRFLLVANQNAASVVVLSIDRETGLLTETGNSMAIPDPTCICFPA